MSRLWVKMVSESLELRLGALQPAHELAVGGEEFDERATGSN